MTTPRRTNLRLSAADRHRATLLSGTVAAGIRTALRAPHLASRAPADVTDGPRASIGVALTATERAAACDFARAAGAAPVGAAGLISAGVRVAVRAAVAAREEGARAAA